MDIFLLIVLISFTLFLFAMAFAMASFGLTHIWGAPFVPTPKRIVRDMLKFADFKEGEVFMDLGSGDGTMLGVAVKEFGAKRAIGYEINPLLVWYSRFWVRIFGKTKKIKIINENFFTSKIEPVDVIAVYLWPSTMQKLRSKLKSELDPKTRVISRGFKFNGVEPLKLKQGPVSWLYLYRVKDL